MYSVTTTMCTPFSDNIGNCGFLLFQEFKRSQLGRNTKLKEETLSGEAEYERPGKHSEGSEMKKPECFSEKLGH